MNRLDGNPKPVLFLIGILYLFFLWGCPHQPPPADSIEDGYSLFQHGNLEYEHGHYTAAIKDFDNVLQLNSHFAPAYYNRALAKRARGDILGAVEDYMKTIELAPRHIKAHYNLGWIKYELENYRAAVAEFTVIIKLTPKDAKPYFYRAGALRAMGRSEDAQSLYGLNFKNYSLGITDGFASG